MEIDGGCSNAVPLVKLGSTRCRFGPSSTLKWPAGQYRTGSVVPSTDVGAQAHAHTRTALSHMNGDASLASRGSTRAVSAQNREVSETGSSVRGTTPPSVLRRAANAATAHRYHGGGTVAASAGRRCLRSHPSSKPGAVVMVRRYAVNRDGLRSFDLRRRAGTEACPTTLNRPLAGCIDVTPTQRLVCAAATCSACP